MLNRSVDGDVIYFDAALGHEFLDVAVGESVSEIQTDGEHDDFLWEPATSESGRSTGGD